MITSTSLSREEYLRKKRKRKIIKYSLFFFLFILLIGLISYVSHRKELRLGRVYLFGGVLLTEEEVQEKTLLFLSGSHFFIFPKNNTFLFPREDLESYLKEFFKRIDTIIIKKKGFTALSVEIKERKPYAIWCKGLPEKTEGEIEECYFMDQNSTIFAPAPNFSGDAYFKYYGEVGDSPIGKEYIASSTKFIGISDFVTNIKTLSLRPQYILEKGEDDFSMVLSGGGQIYFDTKESLYKVVQNLSALLKTPELAPLNRENLPVHYIDLRYGNKLFYKLKVE
ncbi:MAG TPA: hypothetical protein VGC58_01535 [Candidatus Paceibacterota bacterium]